MNRNKSIDEVRKDIKNSQKGLEESRKLREKTLAEKQDLRQEYYKLTRQLKESKSKSDSAGIKITKVKKKRDQFNDKVKDKIKQLRKLREDRTTILKKFKKGFDPTRMNKRIEQIEYQIETEALSPSQEEKCMKQIKLIKKDLEKGKEILIIDANIKKRSEEITNLRDKADKLHKEFLKFRKEKGYGSFREMLGKINKLRLKYNEVKNKVQGAKTDYTTFSKKLKTNLRKSQKIRHDLDLKFKTKKRKEFNYKKAQIQNKAKKVEEKIKKRQKLTNEDLLVFQQNERNK